MSPFEQFRIKSIINFTLGGVDLSYTNASLFMTIALLMAVFFFFMALKKTTLVPSKMQNFAELIYEFIDDTLVSSSGKEARKFFPLIFSIFIFVLLCNLLGMVPFGFTVTSHIALTFSLSLFLFLFITVVAFIRQGTKFLRHFMPSGTPILLAPLIIPIEIFSYFSRPFSLSIRLSANMIAGHVLLKVLAGFVFTLGIFGILPIPLIIVFTGFEIFVAILQAYIFTILACVYFNDALHSH